MIYESELPKSWKVMKLGEVCHVRNGYAFKSSDYQTEGILLFRQTNLDGKSVSLKHAVYLPLSFLERFKEFRIKKGDVLVGMSGSIGKLCVYNLDEPALQNQRTGLLLFTNAVVGIFVRYYFEVLEKEFVKKSKGVAVQNISVKDIHESNFPLPPLPEQHRIVEKIEALFSELENGIEQLKTAQQQLKIYRQAVLKWAFEGKLTEEWRASQKAKGKSQNAEELLERIKNEREQQAKVSGKKLKPIAALTEKELAELPELPNGWSWMRLGNVIEEPKYGTSKKCDYNIEGKGVLRIPNIGEGVVDLSDLKFAKFDEKEIETYRLEAGDLLIIRSNGSVDLVGRCALIAKKDEEYLFAGYLIRLRPFGTTVNSKYLLGNLSSHELRNQIESKAKSTSGVNNINSGELKALIVPFCSFKEQHQIVQEIESRLSVCDKLEETIIESLQQAEALRQSILKKAFEGKLVPQDSKDSPAPKLLNQIKAERQIKETEMPARENNAIARGRSAKILKHD